MATTNGQIVWGLFVAGRMRITYDTDGKPEDAEMGGGLEQVLGWADTPEDAAQVGEWLLERMGAKAKWTDKFSPAGECGKCGKTFQATEPHAALIILRGTVGGQIEEETKSTRFCPSCSAGIIQQAEAAEKSMASMMRMEAPSTQTRQ